MIMEAKPNKLYTPKPLKKCSIDLSNLSNPADSPPKTRKFTLDFFECGDFVRNS